MLPRQVPFIDWDEWITAKESLFSNNPKKGLDIGSLWRERGRPPVSADSTAQIIQIQMVDSNNDLFNRSELELKLMYSLIIIRAVNGLVDANQQGMFASSVMSHAERIGLPGWIVELRHDATHNQIASINVLRAAVKYLLEWYKDFYWTPQYADLQIISTTILSFENNNNNNDVFLQYVRKSSPTLLVSIYLPLFLDSIIYYSKSNPTQSIDSTQLPEDAILFQNHYSVWWVQLKEILTINPSFIHTLFTHLLHTT
eukprot:gene5585-7710_t